MLKKIIAKLTGVTNDQPRKDLRAMRALEANAIHKKLAEEKKDQILEDKERRIGHKYVSERTSPTEAEIRGPSESEPHNR